MAEDVSEIFAVVVESADDGPMLMETGGYWSSEEEASERLSKLTAGNRFFRGCIVRLEFHSGNPLVLHGMKALQHSPESLSHFERRKTQ